MGDGRAISYYFSLVSPWAYIGHAHFIEVARRHGVAIDHRPMALSTVFPGSGGLPLPKRHPSRQRYRMLELQRWRERRGLSFDLTPRFWPFDASLADRVVVALVAGGADPESVLPACFEAVWREGRDLADPAELAALLDAGHHDADAVLEAARTDAVADIYRRNARDALDAGVFGSPAYVREGEVFWGQDRIELLDEALTRGRAPFTA